MGNVLFKEEALLVGWTMDGQYLPAHLDFNCNFQFDTSKVTRGFFKLLRKCPVSLAQCEGEQQLNLVGKVVIIHKVHDELDRNSDMVS